MQDEPYHTHSRGCSARLLFEVEPTDPGTFVSVSIFLGVVTLLACLVPAWRATRVSPRGCAP